jgi:hypothetical protein
MVLVTGVIFGTGGSAAPAVVSVVQTMGTSVLTTTGSAGFAGGESAALAAGAETGTMGLHGRRSYWSGCWYRGECRRYYRRGSSHRYKSDSCP